MKLALLGSLGFILLASCKREAPVHAEIRNASTSCQTNSSYLATNATTCTTVAEVFLSGESANQHPWLAYVDRLIDGKEDEAGPAIGVLVVSGSGKFRSTFSGTRGDNRDNPQIGFKVLALQALI